MNEVFELRQQAGLTQALLAQLAGISHATISRYENGHTSPTIETLRRLADSAKFEVVVSFDRARNSE